MAIFVYRQQTEQTGPGNQSQCYYQRHRQQDFVSYGCDSMPWPQFPNRLPPEATQSLTARSNPGSTRIAQESRAKRSATFSFAFLMAVARRTEVIWLQESGRGIFRPRSHQAMVKNGLRRLSHEYEGQGVSTTGVIPFARQTLPNRIQAFNRSREAEKQPRSLRIRTGGAGSRRTKRIKPEIIFTKFSESLLGPFFQDAHLKPGNSPQPGDQISYLPNILPKRHEPVVKIQYDAGPGMPGQTGFHGQPVHGGQPCGQGNGFFSCPGPPWLSGTQEPL